MARRWDLPDDWKRVEKDIYRDLVDSNPDIGNDPRLQRLFDRAMFDMDIDRDERDDAYFKLKMYLWQKYDIDFEDAYDWEAYREWYDTTYG